MTPMFVEIDNALEKILLSAVPYKHADEKLVGFCPMRGTAADGRLMLVGRALYGWAFSFKAPDMSVDAERAKILEETIAFSTSSVDPIQHLHDGWIEDRKKGSKYNPARSSFWSVAKEILKEFSTPEEGQRLLSYLYWTNLYKLSFF